jgi:hypothetical protein
MLLPTAFFKTFSVNQLESEIFDIITFRTFSKMAAKVHCESSRQLGFALSYTPLLPSNGGKKTVFMVTSGLFLCLFRLNYERSASIAVSQMGIGSMSYKSIHPLSQPIPIKMAGCCGGLGVKNLPFGYCYVALNQICEIISL